MRLEWKLKDVQAEASALLSCGIPWFRDHWHFSTATEDYNHGSTIHRENRQLLIIYTIESCSQGKFKAMSDNILEHLGHAIWDNFKRVDQQWSSFCEQSFTKLCLILEENKTHNNNLPPADKRAGWTIQLHHNCNAGSLFIRRPQGMGYIRTVIYVCLQNVNVLSNRNLTGRYKFAQRATICRDIWSFNRDCFNYAKRRSITTFKPETAIKRKAHECSSKKKHTTNK